MKAKLICTLLITAVLTYSCTPDDTSADNNASSFDRRTMLINYADKLIMPAFQDAEVAMRQLRNAVQQFCNNPSQTTLADARNAFKQAGIAWQYVNGYNFGPAGEMGLRKTLNEEIGTFPITATKIESYISNNDTSFNNFDRDSRGLFAIDFLLFENEDTQLLAKYAEQNRKNYLLRCANHAYASISAVSNQWPTYRSEFINSTGTDIGSSTSIFYNEFLKNFEGLKNFKFGVPLGLRPGQNTTLPANVEAYYSGFGAPFAKEHWKACKQIWEGQSKSGENGLGLREYASSVVGGEMLVNNTIAQHAAIDAAFAQLPDSLKLSQLIQIQFSTVNTVHTELQKHTRFYKSDLSSLIGVSVTFSSGDGD
jgi:predicted lipoprotein